MELDEHNCGCNLSNKENCKSSRKLLTEKLTKKLGFFSMDKLIKHIIFGGLNLVFQGSNATKLALNSQVVKTIQLSSHSTYVLA